MKYLDSEIPVCQKCTDSELKMCEKCGVIYCVHYSSETDVRFCGNCLADFKVVESIETKIVEHFNDNNEVTSRRRFVCKSLHLSGTDWLFTNHRIHNLTDEELVATIEYHKEVAAAMLREREDRRVENYQKLSKMKLNFGPRPPHDSTGATINKKETKKRDKTSKVPTADAVASAFATLLGANVSKEKLAELIAGMGKK